MSTHDWTLVAPWWSWPRPGVPQRGRGTRPTFQKYDTSKLVDTFLADPQRRLKFLDGVDRVTEFAGDTLEQSKAKPTERRKLFQPSHFRHYLVVCSLHCDLPGLPPVDRGQVCQQGFVIRKRSITASDADTQAAQSRMRAVSVARRSIATIDRHIAAARRAPKVAGVRLAALQVKRDAALTVLHAKTKELKDWSVAAGLKRSLQGWYASPNDGEGEWRATAEMPPALDEHWFPLYPLIAPDNQPRHDAAGQTIFFGLVPTASSDHDSTPGKRPRFNDTDQYEIRCFVRRHAPDCLEPPAPGGPHCRGQLVWSEPTEVFGLAAHFDLRGTANRPINVRLPDLRALRNQAGQAPLGVAFNTPPLSAVAGGGPTNAEQICSFSIPLITIVAMFVFQLFLPIVILLFQLWFLLLLKFCIPPELTLDAGLKRAIELDPGMVEADANFDIDIKAGLVHALGLFGPGDELAKDADTNYPDKFNAQPRPDRYLLLRRMYGKAALAAPINDLVYEDRVELREVVPA